MKTCKLCGGTLDKLRKIKSKFNSKYYMLFRCENCHSCLFDFYEHASDLNDLYEDRAEELNFNKEFIYSSYWQGQVNEVLNICPNVKSILDIGCRNGDFLLHWPPQYRRIGVELSEKAANTAIGFGLEVHKSFVEEIDFGDETFDLVSCYAVLEHIVEPLPVIDRLAGLVNEGGIISIMLPTMECWKARVLYLLHYRWHMLTPPEHLNLYSRRFLDDYMQDRGFSLVRRKYTSGGLFNPFAKVPVLGKVVKAAMYIVDNHTIINKFPIFDHMYSFYIKN